MWWCVVGWCYVVSHVIILYKPTYSLGKGLVFVSILTFADSHKSSDQARCIPCKCSCRVRHANEKCRYVSAGEEDAGRKGGGGGGGKDTREGGRGMVDAMEFRRDMALQTRTPSLIPCGSARR